MPNIISRLLRPNSRMSSDYNFSLDVGDNITPGPNLPWTPIGKADDHLLRELEALYWIGVEQELHAIILTLRRWQQPEFQHVKTAEEEGKEDTFIHGFDTFVDQVSQESRALARRASQYLPQRPNHLESEYINAMRQRAIDISAERRSALIKASLRERLENRHGESDILRRRARMLLQAAGFLDIEKLIEHRSRSSGGGGPGVPQLRVVKFDRRCMPVFTELQCGHCSRVICGSMFEAVSENSSRGEGETVCEDCYWEHYYGEGQYVKHYKHCVLSEATIRAASRKIYQCDGVPRFDADGQSRDLFPVGKDKNHYESSCSSGVLQCGLLKLNDLVAKAKYEGMLTTSKINKLNKFRSLVDEEQKNDKKKNKSTGQVNGNRHQRKSLSLGSMTTDEDVPFFLRKYVEKDPFANVHMALRIGPLVIENGVAHTKDGVLISVRHPTFSSHQDNKSACQKYLAVSNEAQRRVWSQTGNRERRRRFKAVLKQIIGAPFSGCANSRSEDEFIGQLIAASQSTSENEPEKQLSTQLLAKLKALIGPSVSIYLRSIAAQILDPNVNIRWNAKQNNCQRFCDSLIDWSLFGPLLAQSTVPANDNGQETTPLYVMSFVCRPGKADGKPKNKTEFDVPNGLIEDYLWKFRYGRQYNESDIIDSLHEYWHDWGAFGGPLYRHQDLFPWDCTEAHGRYAGKCGECTLAKHLLAFPFDSWSILSLHIARDRYLYAPLNPNARAIMSDEEWMRNRLTVLTAQDYLLSVAVAMAREPRFKQATAWLHKEHDPRNDRLKLGGIHRAQPYNHINEKGEYHRYFIADWAHLALKDQIEAYETLRDSRARIPDIRYKGHVSKGFAGVGSGYGGGGGFSSSSKMSASKSSHMDSGFLATVIMAGSSGGGSNCASGCASNCGTGCGSSTCGAIVFVGSSSGCGGGSSGGGGCGGGGGC